MKLLATIHFMDRKKLYPHKQEYNYWIESSEIIGELSFHSPLTFQGFRLYNIVTKYGRTYDNSAIILTGLQFINPSEEESFSQTYKMQEIASMKEIGQYYRPSYISSIESVSGFNIHLHDNATYPYSGFIEKHLVQYIKDFMVHVSTVKASSNKQEDLINITTAPLNDNSTTIYNSQKKERKEKTMFENLKNKIDFGKVEDVKMSIYGPAFETKDGQFLAFNSKTSEYIEVEDFILGDESFCFKMPVAAKDLKVNDFIRHNDQWCRITDFSSKDHRPMVEKIADKEEVRVISTKSLFGFDFYTKLIPLVNDSFFKANDQNPFGNLPLLMMLSDTTGDMKNLLPMMMLSQGGSNINPLMLMMMSNSDKDYSQLMPLLMMQGNIMENIFNLNSSIEEEVDDNQNEM